MSGSGSISPIEFEGGAEKISVILPCEPEHFSKFVASLLGRPQVISGHVSGAFEVGRSDIENLYHLINQHVLAQENSTLMSFNLRIIYDDSSSVDLNSIDEFIEYNEVKPLKSTGVVLSWIFLVKFRLKDVPEKQQIDITLNAGKAPIEGSSYVSRPYIESMHNHNRITYRISHTNRSWAAATQSLIVNQLSFYTRPLKGALNFFNENAAIIGFVAGFCIFLFFTLAGLSITGEFISRYAGAAQSAAAGGNSTIEIIDKKITHLVDMISSGVWTRYSFYGTFFVIASLVFSIGLGSWIGSAAAFERKSFVALTKISEDDLEEYPEEIRGHWIYLAFSAIISIVVSVSGKLIFAISSKFFGV